MESKIIVFSGPTAVGKTAISISVAKEINAEIVNFDSLLFYKELNIGTAKPSKKEMDDIPHHLIGTHSIKNSINAADFAENAIPIILDIHNRNKPVILVGGSGFYLQALLKGMYDSKTTSPDILEKSQKLYESNGIIPFLEVLEMNDYESFERYHKNDHYRIRRAVEHFWMTGEKFSEAREEMKHKKSESPVEKYNWSVLHNYLDIPKEDHFQIIQKRTNSMIAAGLIDEVESLLRNGASGKEKPMQSIGYKETISYLKGDFASLDDYKERLSINTRRLAKSQRTWFKKQDKVCYNSLKDRDKIIKSCKEFCEIDGSQRKEKP